MRPSIASNRFTSRGFKTMLLGAFLFSAAEFYTQVWSASFKLYYKATKENLEILSHCKDLHSGVFKPTFYLPLASLQVIYGAKYDPVPFVPFDREQVILKDKGAIALDWGPIHKSYSGKDAKKMRILFILHGLTGGSETNYVRHAVLNASRYGFRPVVYHNRGVNSDLTTEKYHNVGEIEDISEILQYIQKENPEARIYGLGISIGANILSNYAGELKEESIIKGFVSIANPYDIYECSKHINKWNKSLYDYYMTQGFIKNLIRNEKHLRKNLGIDIESAMKSKKTKDFDEYITRRLFGFHDVDEYYRAAGCLPRISSITVPGLFINSLDDPICE